MEIVDIIAKHFLFFAVGILQDILITYYYQTIAKEQAWKAAFFSTTVTLVNMVILYQILTGIENQVISIILAYALGNGVGTFLVMKKHWFKKIFESFRKQNSKK